MSNIIDFLARMGASATLRTSGRADLANELTASDVEPTLAAAILAGDDVTLRDRLAPGKFFGIQLDQEEPEEQEDGDEESSVRFAQRRA